jgi:hypothetical protein
MNAVSRDEFVALLRSRCSARLREHLLQYDLDVMLGQGGFAVHEGDLAPEEDWHPGADNLLVLGSITCGGVVSIAPEGVGGWGGSLWVLGNVRCRHLAGRPGAPLVADGNLTVAGVAVVAFEDSMLVVAGDFAAQVFYGLDIWANVGGRAVMEYGVGYALPFGYDDAASQAIMPRRGRDAALALLNLECEEAAEELVAKLRRGEHSRTVGRG